MLQVINNLPRQVTYTLGRETTGMISMLELNPGVNKVDPVLWNRFTEGRPRPNKELSDAMARKDIKLVRSDIFEAEAKDAGEGEDLAIETIELVQSTMTPDDLSAIETKERRRQSPRGPVLQAIEKQRELLDGKTPRPN